MSALGHKRTYAVHKSMSALPPIATAKADFRTPPKADMCSALAYVCFGAIADMRRGPHRSVRLLSITSFTPSWRGPEPLLRIARVQTLFHSPKEKLEAMWAHRLRR